MDTTPQGRSLTKPYDDPGRELERLRRLRLQDLSEVTLPDFAGEIQEGVRIRDEAMRNGDWRRAAHGEDRIWLGYAMVADAFQEAEHLRQALGDQYHPLLDAANAMSEAAEKFREQMDGIS